MAHLHLPVEHDDQDLAMAGALAGALRSEDLYVTWSRSTGAARPVIPAEIREACETRKRRRRLRDLFRHTD
jgi:hypothetical protein